jgi:hypothetical protein
VNATLPPYFLPSSGSESSGNSEDGSSGNEWLDPLIADDYACGSIDENSKGLVESDSDDD